jgi:outer membrane protein assembly factor BamB
MILRLACLASVLAAGVGLSRADDWPAFRGPAGDGISSDKAVPAEWGPAKNMKWKVPLPYRGNGSPIVSNGRIFVTCPEDGEGKKRSLYCFDRKDGKKLWVATVDFGKATETHSTNPHSSSTPVSDGKHVVAWHDSAGLFCYDFEGKELWKKNLGEFDHIWGAGTSPILHDGKVILNTGPGKRVFVTAISVADGKTLWETEEPCPGPDSSYNDETPEKKYKGSWGTPVIVTSGGAEQVVCTMPTRILGYSLADGRILWSCEGIRPAPGDLAYSSPVIAGEVAVVIAGFGGPGFGVKLGGSGDVTKTNQLWRNQKYPQSIGTGVHVEGSVYLPFEGFIQCMDPKTGKSLWRERGGTFWGSAVVASGRIYITDQKGTTWVLKPNPEKLEVVAKNELGEMSNSTPAVSDGQIFIRTHKSLWCFGE